MRLTVGEIMWVVGGEVVAGRVDEVVSSFTNDSREVGRQACFLALRDHRDGHDFVRDAFGAGAVAALVERIPEDLVRDDDHAVIRVRDVRDALGELGRRARDALIDVTVVGITGSAGKTSTKDLTVAALARRRLVHANVASFNNEIGLPLTLLDAPLTTEVVVTEMGARFAGNIRDLCEIAKPTIGVVTHIGMAHAEHLGSAEGIAAVKGELVEALPATGLAVLNADDPATPALVARSVARVLQVGLAACSDGDVRVRDIELDDELRARFTLETPWGEGEVRLRVRGEHQVMNAAMSAAVALSLDVPFEEIVVGLETENGSGGRMQLERTDSGVLVLDDTYNASPSSTAAALRSLAHLPVDGARLAVLGEMRELGAHSRDAHARIGALAVELGIDLVVTVGENDGMSALAKAIDVAGGVVTRVRDVDAACAELAASLVAGDAVLVKASRAVGLERVVEALRSGAVEVSAT